MTKTYPRLAVVATAGLCAFSASVPLYAQQSYIMPPTVVTATGRPEPVSRIAGTVQVIQPEAIERSSAKSVTELFAENAVGFMSEWTGGQTSLNIRGAATEGQGRDFRSQVLVLINGHRAGTANISKLSIADVERIEIVRGPASVVYGSQNMGGVVNIILKTGRSAPGTMLEASGGSWGLLQGKAQSGGTVATSVGAFDYYVGLAGGKRDNYETGGGPGNNQTEANTAWTRAGGMAALGWQIDANSRLDVTLRSDGVYDAGFRGSAGNLFAFDTRYNRSIDASFNAQTADGRGGFFFQGYYVQDVDDLNNPSPLSALNAVAARTVVDHNRRQLDIVGTRFQPRYSLFGGNDLLMGFDWERSWISSERERRGGAAATPTSPQDNNQTENVFAFYAEDAQSFFGDVLTLRGGVRQTMGTTMLTATPFAPTLIPSATNYQATTWSAGATVKATDWLGFRAGASTGFRAPTATELGANFTIVPIGTSTFGNPSLGPETSRQLEVGTTLTARAARFDLVLFQNVIANRIITVPTSVTTSQFRNNPSEIVVQGLEFQADADLVKTLGLSVPETWRWSVFGNGYYNFKMTDYGALPAAQSDRVVRMNEYETSLGTRFGQSGNEIPWSVQLLGILRGPMWYNTEESLSPTFFPGQIRSTTVYRKDAFWVFNSRGEVEVRKGVKVFAAVNNILDVNQHPIFIALDQNPCGANQINQNGTCGNSMPGREFVLGVQVRF